MHIRTAGAAGKLNVGFWDHWVPNGTEAMRKQVIAWADKNKVEVQADFITSQGNKLLLTAAAEAQAKTGHDFIPFFQWDVLQYADQLEPVDDVIKYLIGRYGAYDPVIEYLAKKKDSWVAVPGTDPTASLTCCARISMLKNLRRHRCAGDVPGASGGPIAGRRMDLRCVPESGGGVPQGRLSVRHGVGADG